MPMDCLILSLQDMTNQIVDHVVKARFDGPPAFAVEVLTPNRVDKSDLSQ